MTKSEFKKLVAKSPNKEFLDNLSISITFQKIGDPIVLKSLVDLFDFISDQISGWESKSNISLEICNVGQIIGVRNWLEEQLQNYLEVSQNENQLKYWKDYTLKDNINTINYFLSDYFHHQSNIIIKISDEFGEEAGLAAFNYFKRNIGISSFNTNHLKGFISAYEMDIRPSSGIFSRIKTEIQGISKINEKYQALVTELNSQHVGHLKAANDDLKTHLAETEAFKNEKEKLFNDWYANAQKTNIDFDKDSRNKILELEEIYEKKLQLQAPAKYWDKKSREYLRQAILTRNLLTIIIAVFGGLFAAILIISPDWIFKTVFEGNHLSIVRWSIVFIALISLLVYIVKAITKVMFSSFHLARDAEERHTLTFFYLALLNDPKSEIKDEERKLIIQSLFSRADTGLLKGDSSPEMPNDFLGKILGKS